MESLCRKAFAQVWTRVIARTSPCNQQYSRIVSSSGSNHGETKGDLSIHVLTVTGILAGMAALVAVLENKPSNAIIWLLIALVIDGVDGPIARRWLTNTPTPRFDGYILDLVIDYVTCVIVPAAFLWQFTLVSHGNIGQLAIAAVIGSSALWFSQTDIESDDHFFRGFPAAWNMVVPTLWVLQAGTEFNIAVTFGLSVLTLSNIEFAHTLKVKKLRVVNVMSTLIWMAAIVTYAILDKEVGPLDRLIILIGPFGLTISAIDRVIVKRRVTFKSATGI